MSLPLRRAALFGLTGLLFFGSWLVTDPSFDVSPIQGEWPFVLAFSALILTLALAVPQFADMVGGRAAFRASRTVAVGAVLSSAANILALAIVLVARDGQRHFALVPAGAIAGLLLYVVAGGPLKLVTWLLAAGLALAPARDQAKESLA